MGGTLAFEFYIQPYLKDFTFSSFILYLLLFPYILAFVLLYLYILNRLKNPVQYERRLKVEEEKQILSFIKTTKQLTKIFFN